MKFGRAFLPLLFSLILSLPAAAQNFGNIPAHTLLGNPGTGSAPATAAPSASFGLAATDKNNTFTGINNFEAPFANPYGDAAAGLCIKTNTVPGSQCPVQGALQNDPTSAAWYNLADTVGLVAWTQGWVPWLSAAPGTISGSRVTLTTPLTASQLAKMRVRQVLDTGPADTPRCSGSVSAWNANGTTIDVFGWYRQGGTAGSTATCTPTASNTVTSRATSIFAANLVADRGAGVQQKSSVGLEIDSANGSGADNTCAGLGLDAGCDMTQPFDMALSLVGNGANRSAVGMLVNGKFVSQITLEGGSGWGTLVAPGSGYTVDIGFEASSKFNNYSTGVVNTGFVSKFNATAFEAYRPSDGGLSFSIGGDGALTISNLLLTKPTPFTFAADGSGSLLWTTPVLWNTNNTGTHTNQQTTFAVRRTMDGSGTNGPSQSDSAAILSAGKNNYLTSAVQGEVDTLWLYSWQGKLGDSSAILAQVDRIDDGGANPNYGSLFAEAVVNTRAPTTGTILRSLDVHLGQMTTSPTSVNTPVSVGFGAEAQRGGNGIGFLGDTCDTSGAGGCAAGSNAPSLATLIQGRKGRVNSNIYFDVTGNGFVGIGKAADTTWKFDLLSANNNMRVKSSSGQSVLFVDNSSTGSNSLIAVGRNGVQEYALMDSGGTIYIYDLVNNAGVFSALNLNVTVGAATHSTTLAGQVIVPNISTGTPTAAACFDAVFNLVRKVGTSC